MKFTKNPISTALASLAFSAIVITGASVYAPQASAQIPTTDVGSLMQAIESGIMRAKESGIMQAIEKAKMKAMALYSELEIDGINNAFSNMIARTGKAMQDIQNMEQLEKSMPAQDVCDTIDMTVKLEDMLCDTDNQIFMVNAERRGKRAITSGTATQVCQGNSCTIVNRAPTVEEVSSYNAKEAEFVMTECARLSAREGRDLCTTASNLVNPPPQGLNNDEYKALMLQVKIANNPIVQPPNTDATMDVIKGTPAHYKSLIKDKRLTQMKDSIESSMTYTQILLHGTYNEQTGERKRGEVALIDDFMSSRLGSDQWLCEVTNTCQGGAQAPYVSPAELEKRKIQMEAVMMYVGVQQYKSSLRIEKLLSDIAILQLDPPGR